MSEQKATMDELLIELLGTASLVGSIDNVSADSDYIHLEGKTHDGRGYYISLCVKEAKKDA